MALSASHLTEYRRLLNTLSAAARRDLQALLAGVDVADAAAMREALAPVWPLLVADYGQASASLGAVLFEAMADDLSVAPRVVLADPVDPAKAAARMMWATGTNMAVGNLTTILDELVKQPARETIQSSAHKSGGAWARVPQGAKSCAFCRMLGSRGAVYANKRTAGYSGSEFHGACDCGVVFVRNERDYPEGYDPDALYQAYLDADGTTTQAILASMRAAGHTH